MPSKYNIFFFLKILLLQKFVHDNEASQQIALENNWSIIQQHWCFLEVQMANLLSENIILGTVLLDKQN